MSEPKFTPGPWNIGTPPPNNEQTIGTKDGMMIAVVTTGVNMVGATLANAHLIAAAPDLYSALKMVLDDPYVLDGRPRTYKYVQTALAKARGEG